MNNPLLDELVKLAETARRCHELAREFGDGEMMALLQRLGWTVATVMVHIGKQQALLIERLS